MTQHRDRPWRLAIFVTAFVLASCERGKLAPPETEHTDAFPIVETKDMPPVITVGDLVPLGFDTTTIYAIEAHIHQLNGALVTLADLKRAFDATTDSRERQRLNAYAVPFHVTADTHQRAILNALRPPLDSVFDRYVEDRKTMVGLQDWHRDHRIQGPSTELPGLTPAPPRRQH